MGAPERGAPRAQSIAHGAVEQAPLVVVVLTLDGVRYQEIFEGVDARLAQGLGVLDGDAGKAEQLMPHLHAIIATHGAALGAPEHGAAISASGPNFVSLPGYAEIFSGRRATRCRDNRCRSGGSPTLIDDFGSGPSQAEPDLAVITSWSEIERVAGSELGAAAVSTGRHGGRTRRSFGVDPGASEILERAAAANPWPGHDDFRPDRFTAELALYQLSHHRPRFLFVGLGEPDEFGHAHDYGGYLGSLRRADEVIASFDRELARLAQGGARTMLFVTSDHGRAANFAEHGERFPESARVWLIATGSACTARGLLTARTPHHLADIAPTIRQLAGLPVDPSELAGEPLRELFAR